MATKPPATAKPATTAVAKRASNNVVNIKEALRKQAEDLNSRVAPATGNSISIKGSEFRLPDGRKTTDPIEVVVVDFTAMNSFYETKFDPGQITPPACFAMGSNPLKLVPSDNAPLRQSDSCSGCPMNEFGSDGKGKACKNTRVLAVLPADADADTPMWRLVVPPTSIKNWDDYVRSVSSMMQMPPVAVVTTISFDDTVDYPRLKFGAPTPNQSLEVHFARQGEASEMLATEPDTSQFAATKAAPARKVAGAKRR